MRTLAIFFTGGSVHILRSFLFIAAGKFSLVVQSSSILFCYWCFCFCCPHSFLLYHSPLVLSICSLVFLLIISRRFHSVKILIGSFLVFLKIWPYHLIFCALQNLPMFSCFPIFCYFWAYYRSYYTFLSNTCSLASFPFVIFAVSIAYVKIIFVRWCSR